MLEGDQVAFAFRQLLQSGRRCRERARLFDLIGKVLWSSGLATTCKVTRDGLFRK